MRVKRGVAKERRISIRDAEMRHGRKNKSTRVDGFKRHLALDVDTTLILAAAITPAKRRLATAGFPSLRRPRPEGSCCNRAQRSAVSRSRHARFPMVIQFTSTVVSGGPARRCQCLRSPRSAESRSSVARCFLISFVVVAGDRPPTRALLSDDRRSSVNSMLPCLPGTAVQASLRPCYAPASQGPQITGAKAATSCGSAS